MEALFEYFSTQGVQQELDNNNFYSAISLIEKELERGIDNPWMYFTAAMVYSQLEPSSANLEKAKQCLERAKALSKDEKGLSGLEIIARVCIEKTTAELLFNDNNLSIEEVQAKYSDSASRIIHLTNEALHCPDSFKKESLESFKSLKESMQVVLDNLSR